MSLDFTPTKFGQQAAAGKPAQDDRPKAELWVNVGYTSEMLDENGAPYFISLAQGIPVDTLEPLPTNSRNDRYAAFNAGRNDLQEQLLQFAADLAPGEARVIKLEVQIRRVNAPAEPISAENNPMVRKLSL